MKIKRKNKRQKKTHTHRKHKAITQLEASVVPTHTIIRALANFGRDK